MQAKPSVLTRRKQKKLSALKNSGGGGHARKPMSATKKGGGAALVTILPHKGGYVVVAGQGQVPVAKPGTIKVGAVVERWTPHPVTGAMQMERWVTRSDGFFNA